MAVPTYQTFKPYYEETLRTPKTFPLQDITIQTLFPPNLISYQTWFVKPCYNVYMSPRHFANYAKNNPEEYKAFSDNLWNSFVAVTHAIGLSPYFSFTPDFLDGLDSKAIGKQLGEVYNLSNSDQQAEGRFAKGEIPGDK